MLLRDCSDGWQAFSLSEVEHSPAAKQGKKHGVTVLEFAMEIVYIYYVDLPHANCAHLESTGMAVCPFWHF